MFEWYYRTFQNSVRLSKILTQGILFYVWFMCMCLCFTKLIQASAYFVVTIISPLNHNRLVSHHMSGVSPPVEVSPPVHVSSAVRLLPTSTHHLSGSECLLAVTICQQITHHRSLKSPQFIRSIHSLINLSPRV